MEEQTPVWTETVDGYLIEYFEVDDEIGYSVAFTDTREMAADPEDVTIPAAS